MAFHVIPWPDMLSRLAMAFLLGALIGFERERHQRPAGLRTHVLVSLASALFTMVSIYAAGEDFDPGRVAAQIVTGIGFLGAGTIMRHGSVVRGLTTAASLWTAGALGMAAGFGWFMAAAAAAIMAFAALTVLKLLEDRVPRLEPSVKLLVEAVPGKDPLPAVLDTLRRLDVRLESITFGEEMLTEGLQMLVAMHLPATLDRQALREVIAAQEAVADVSPGQ